RGQACRLTRLAGRAIPGAAPRKARLLDRRAAAVARLAQPAVHLELFLHRPGAPVRLAVVAQGRALALDAGLERALDSFAQSAHFVPVEVARRPERIDARAPERLV